VVQEWGRTMMDTNEIGRIIKTLRRKRDMTQTEMADALNLASSTISNWEHGRRLPSIDELKRIASLFKVSLNVFHVDHGTSEEHVNVNKDIATQIIDFKPLGIKIHHREWINAMIALTLIMLSNLMPFELVFALHIVGLFLIAAILSIIVNRMLNQRQLPSKRIQYPADINVYYRYKKENDIKKTETLIRFLFLASIMIVMIMFVSVYVLLSRQDNQVLNMVISLIGLVYLLIHFLAYRVINTQKIIQANVPYYKVHKRLRYLTLYATVIINVVFLSVFNMIVAIRVDLFDFGLLDFIVSFLAYVASIISLMAVVVYNDYVSGLDITSNKGK
jgi:transcriptional regulator with XRE-family HTH domain